ncbi:MAG: hypothetical protein NUV98_04750 [Candidatus Roizmanbacteria bacterium]|nr:hypothetical protein [Candidatus Roizmanbacteria bacterium]
MNKGLLIALIAGGVLVLGVAAFFFMNRESVSDTMPGSNPPSNSKTSANQPQSLRALMQLGSNQTCTFSDTESQSEGTVYIAGGNVRGDFSSELTDSEMVSHMIVTDETMYMWVDGQTSGFKMSLTELEEAQDDTALNEQNSPKSVDIDKQIDYECSSWRVENSVFTPPSTIEFTDFSEMMESAEGMMEESDTDTSDQCAVCANLPDSAKQQCLDSFSCN